MGTTMKHSLLWKEDHQTVGVIRPLSAGAELKHRDRVWGKGEEIALLLWQVNVGPQQTNVLKTVPLIGKNCEEFYSKREKNRFSDGSQDWDKHAFFLWGHLNHQSWSQEILV